MFYFTLFSKFTWWRWHIQKMDTRKTITVRGDGNRMGVFFEVWGQNWWSIAWRKMYLLENTHGKHQTWLLFSHEKSWPDKKGHFSFGVFGEGFYGVWESLQHDIILGSSHCCFPFSSTIKISSSRNFSDEFRFHTPVLMNMTAQKFNHTAFPWLAGEMVMPVHIHRRF